MRPIKAIKGRGQAMFACNGLILVASFLAFILAFGGEPGRSLVECQEQLTVESRQQKDNEELTDTIKYLEKLDKYFSQIARPRFGRSESPRRLLMAGQLNTRLPILENRQAASINNEDLSRYAELPIMDILAARFAHKYSNRADSSNSQAY